MKFDFWIRVENDFFFFFFEIENWTLISGCNVRSWFCVGIMSMITWIWVLVILIVVWTTVVWYDERRFVMPFTEQRAGGLLRMLKYSVSRYWCNGIRGFHMEQWGCFWWVFLSRYHPVVPTVSLYVPVLLHLLLSTSSGRRNIHVPFMCSISRVPRLNHQHEFPTVTFWLWRLPPLNLSRHSPRPGV